jgi:hypothetical protein
VIAPKMVSHVQPTGRDYSGTTSPDMITGVPPARCPECAGNNGAHGSVHVRHEAGGGGWNRPCSRSTTADELTEQDYEACKCNGSWHAVYQHDEMYAGPTTEEQSEYGLDLARAVREARAAGELGHVTLAGAVLIFAAVAAVAMVVALSILGLDTAGLEPIVWTNRSFR